MGSANERKCYIVTPLFGWAHAQNDHCFKIFKGFCHDWMLFLNSREAFMVSRKHCSSPFVSNRDSTKGIIFLFYLDPVSLSVCNCKETIYLAQTFFYNHWLTHHGPTRSPASWTESAEWPMALTRVTAGLPGSQHAYNPHFPRTSGHCAARSLD